MRAPWCVVVSRSTRSGPRTDSGGVGLGAAVLAAVSTLWLQRGLDAVDPRQVLRVRDGKGDAPCLEKVEPGQLGLLPSDYPQVRLTRTADIAATDLLAEDPRLLIAAGPRLAGVTTVVFAAALPLWAHRRALVFVDPSGEEITGGYRLGCWYAERGVASVLWLEHLTGRGLVTLAAAVGSHPVPDRVSIIATTADTDWPHTLPAPARSFWQSAQHLNVGCLTESEETELRNNPRLAAVVPALEAGERMLGRLLVARGPARAVLSDNGHRGAQVALLRLCIDWDRAHISLALSSEHVSKLYPLYWRQARRIGNSDPVPARDLAKAQATLTKPRRRSFGIAWLTDTDRGLLPHPLLVDIADSGWEPVAWNTPARVVELPRDRVASRRAATPGRGRV